MFFHLAVDTPEGTNSYEIQMRYLQHLKIYLLANQDPKMKYQKLIQRDMTQWAGTTKDY